MEKLRMTSQEVLDVLIDAKHCRNAEHEKQVNEAIEVLQELVDKTAPKKMMNVTSHDDHEFGDYVYSTGYCPICNKIFYFDALVDVINYCPNCGQKLSWDGKHERVGVA